ncbi:MAG TPA: hypothetical protein VHW74_01130 [Mycobacteriales bacterium]|nr:hypothetical protein [Mycobacteriales bacterium]
METETNGASGDQALVDPASPALLSRLEALVERPALGAATASLPVAPVVAASLAGLRAEMSGLDERLVAIEDTVASLADRLESRMTSLDDRLAALAQSLGSERTVAEQHRERTSEALQEQAAALDEWAEAVRAGLEDLGDAVASSLGTLGDTLQDPAAREADRRHLEAMLTEVMTSVDEATRPIDAQMSTLYGGVLDGFAAARDGLIDDLGGALESLERAAVATRENVEGQLSELRNDFADALDEMREHVSTAVGTSSDTVAGSLDELRSDWQPRADKVVAEGKAAAQGVLDEVRSDVRRAMTDLSDSLEGQIAVIANATGTIGGGTDRLVAAGQSLVAYLVERDRILERERDRVLREVLDEFAEGLSPRERRAVASRVGEAVDRRRDTRDAERFRRATPGRDDFGVPPVPELLDRLAEPLPEPVTPVLPRRSTLRPPPPPQAKTTPPPAKKTAQKAAAPAKRAVKKTTSPVKKTPVKTAKKAAPTSTDGP